MLPSIFSEIQDHNLYPALIRQLNKDLGLTVLTTNDTAEVLRTKLLDYLSHPSTDILSILYRTDVDESQIPPNFGPEELAYLILERVWNKVKLRHGI